MKTTVIIISALLTLQTFSQIKRFEKINYQGDAKIEVGSYFAGAEFHHSCPIPQRFSFYYPVANSIDLSSDYWHRDTTYIMNTALKFDDEFQWLNNQSYKYELTPYSVKFYKYESDKSFEISYQFTKTKPTVVITYSITNNSNEKKEVELFIRLALALRTSHTFEIKKEINISSMNNGEIIFANNLAKETQNSRVFIVNVTEKPFDIVLNESLSNKINFQKYASNKNLIDEPSANFIYKKILKPKEKLIVTQILGTCKIYEGNQLVNYLRKNYKKEIKNFENFILSRINKTDVIKSGDDTFDKTVNWAKAILEVNKHYIDGDIVPMPCPAEYNFYFTHDVLMTDFAAVKFDLLRVKNDLMFIIKHANKEKIIPHAYYWKDTAYVTEYADYDNWNNFWFIIVASEYLKYSKDKKFIEQIYPYLEKSLSNALKTKGEDNLMLSYRPDWWDIGKLYGQRSYMTILAIQAIRSYIYLSTVIEKNEDKLSEYENLSDRMEKSLNEKLWLDNFNYLMNCSELNVIDEHYYSGSLLAAHFGLIDSSKNLRMIKTAEEFLIDKKVGVYTVYPMDFTQLRDYWHFAGNEAGEKFYYLNGGIWFHSNAWYALALISIGKKNKAGEFIKNVMTIDGIINGPNGQPAMYEVRNGDYNNLKIYGTIDKPQFMWAAGWYLYTLYHLFGINNNEWNIELNPFLLYEQSECLFNLYINGRLANVNLVRNKFLQNKIDKKEINSFVIPEKLFHVNQINFSIGELKNAFLKSTNSILEEFTYDKNKMDIHLKAFKGHKNKTIIISKHLPKEIKLNRNHTVDYSIHQNKNEWIINISFTHQEKLERLTVQF
ncbi:MAG: hypothetical protein QHH13_12055 [Melioribacter sp.]|uniref:GH36-type glycosyl hydrolase domain-containing protein n=1 Tax=Rosettibacter primus TaxID=3111523 RepID=UPI00247DD89D|nr:hypothetical protein [Melioribacter sp.]